MGEHVMGQIAFADHRARAQQLSPYYAAALVDRTISCESGLHERLRTGRGLGDGRDLGALVELAAYGRSLLAEYQAQGVPAPDWLEPNLKLVREAIKAAHRAALQAKLRQAERELEELKSREEKRAEKEQEVRRLREELG